jgi:alcohol dehydrogenase YqhD (iron-dependent ADH family)
MNVWDVDSGGKSDEQIAAEGLKKMEAHMKELGLTMHLKELGVTEEMLPGIVESTLIMDGGYKVPDKDEIREILKNSL